MDQRLEHVVARNATALRRNRGMTQLDLARAMAEVGMGWTPGRAQQVETFAGTLSLVEVLGLCWALEVPLADLLTGDDHIALPGGRRIDLQAFRDALAGRGARREPDRSAEDAADYEEVRAKAAQLDVSPDVFNRLCQHLFGRSFRAERDATAGDLTHLRPRSAQVKRGHAGRAVLADLREHITTVGGPATASLVVYQATADELEAQLAALEQRTADAGPTNPGQDQAEARELVTESTALHAALDKLRDARYLHADENLLERVDQLRARVGLAQLHITTTYRLHLRTHLGSGEPL